MIKYAPRLPPASPKAEKKPLRGRRPGPSSTTRHAHPVCLPRWITDKDPSLSRVTDLGIFLSFPFSLYHRALPADIPATPVVLRSALLRLPPSRRCTRPKVPPRWGKSTSSLLPRVWCPCVCACNTLQRWTARSQKKVVTESQTRRICSARPRPVSKKTLPLPPHRIKFPVRRLARLTTWRHHWIGRKWRVYSPSTSLAVCVQRAGVRCCTSASGRTCRIPVSSIFRKGGWPPFSKSPVQLLDHGSGLTAL